MVAGAGELFATSVINQTGETIEGCHQSSNVLLHFILFYFMVLIAGFCMYFASVPISLPHTMVT